MMEGACPAFSVSDPLVGSLLSVVDCNLQGLIQAGYVALFQPEGAFGALLTAGLTIYVALIGYQLLLGRAALNISALALSGVKLAAVVALATQWGVYQKLVYHLLFFGPEQLANLVSRPLWSGSGQEGDVFDGLQRAFADLTAFSPATPPGGTAATAAGPVAAGAGQLSTLLSRAGFDSVLLLGSAVLLLLSTLGVLIACKIVLGLLLAFGPVFIALMLFESTQGLFEGWLRAALGFAFAPLAVTLLLGFGLVLLEPSLRQIETMRGQAQYIPGVGFGVAVIVTALAGVSLGMVAAGGVIAGGFRLPRAVRPAAAYRATPTAATAVLQPLQSRTDRMAGAILARGRYGAAPPLSPAGYQASGAGVTERRLTLSPTPPSPQRAAVLETRLGQQPRRSARPRTVQGGPSARSGAT
jgi:type IV secretion system protein VirB6